MTKKKTTKKKTTKKQSKAEQVEQIEQVEQVEQPKAEMSHKDLGRVEKLKRIMKKRYGSDFEFSSK